MMNWKEECARLRSRIEKLNKIGIALTSEMHLDRLLDLIVRVCRNFTNADGGSLYLKEEDHLAFKVFQNETLENRFPGRELCKPFKLPIDQRSIAGFVASTGNILNIDDVYQLPDNIEYKFARDFDVMMGYRTKSMLVAPMKNHQDETIGVIQLINCMENQEIVPFDPSYESTVLSLASQAAISIDNTNLMTKMRQLFGTFVEYSASAIDLRSRHTGGHSRRVMEICMAMAEIINEEEEGPFADVHFGEEALEEFRYAAWLHDIGKIAIKERILEKSTKLSPDRMEAIRERFEAIKLRVMLDAVEKGDQEKEREIAEIAEDLRIIEKANVPGYLSDREIDRIKALSNQQCTFWCGGKKPYLTDYEAENLCCRQGNLNPTEYEEMKSHVFNSYQMLKKIPFPKHLSRVPIIAGGHHEMMDGSGYPFGLKGEEIPLQCRIMAIADIYDALTAVDRPYRKAVTPQEGIDVLNKMAKNGLLDRNLVKLFSEKLFPKLSQRVSSAVSIS